MLDAVGFDATVEVAPAPAASARQFTGDYEMAIGGLATTGADPASTLASSLTPGGAVKGVSRPSPRRCSSTARFSRRNRLRAGFVVP
ncbi:hypothetical protein ES5_01086 [Dietzia cinnamea P4]|nr:hypothetical protein ES5_01086 [Dietzia cinnamea P4]OAH57130.1 hypothetical protein AYJ66_15115 [Dietzia cinnamea]